METILSIALSAHLGFEGEYNRIHPHIRLQDESFIAGAYYNSERRISLYAGLEFTPFEDVGLEIGIVSGYPGYTIIPFARGTYKDLFVAPGIEYGNITGIVGGYEFKF